MIYIIHASLHVCGFLLTSKTSHVAQLQWKGNLQGLLKKVTAELSSSCGRQTENK